MVTVNEKVNDIFCNGSTWVRADFHLHTRADKEFNYSDEENWHNSVYIDGLSVAGIRVGVITNHNKFDQKEFRALRKAAKKKDILLLPGVELSVNDGANGVHTLVVFSDSWLENEHSINQLLSVLFSPKSPSEYEQGYCRTECNLIDTIKKIEDYHKDFFIIFAHVEKDGGLWHELDGGRLRELVETEPFRQRTLGFQKVRTHNNPNGKCRLKAQEWFGNWYPAEVEGSDCKSVGEIGRGKHCYLKIGDFSFEAVKYALLDHVNRVYKEPKAHDRSHILNASFEGGGLAGKTIPFSSQLNTLIGIRGSGKSSILEAIRYAFDIPFGDKSSEQEYKKQLISNVLGSGGRITVQAVDRRGRQYEIKRIFNETPKVYVDGVYTPGVSLRDTILHKPLYFGQKDLSNTGEGFEKDLVEKLVGEKVSDIRSRIDEQRHQISEIIGKLKKLSKTEEARGALETKKQDAEYQLRYFEQYGVQEKLERQVNFEHDLKKIAQIESDVNIYLQKFEEVIESHDETIKADRSYQSKENEQFFTEFYTIYDDFIASVTQIKSTLAAGRGTCGKLQEKVKEFKQVEDGLKEKFAEITRQLVEELKERGAKDIEIKEFHQIRATVEECERKLSLLEKDESRRVTLDDELEQGLQRLNELWLSEYRVIEAELKRITEGNPSLVIKAEFKGDGDAVVKTLKDHCKGSYLREETYRSLAKEFPDFGAMYQEFDKVRSIVGSSASAFEKNFNKNLSTLLTWQVPNRYIIEYHGKELKHHSLGQRASALILFVLGQQENDVIIIDQPEDDLDNQTIYKDVVKLIHNLKANTQFIFATHNANFPVLGDAELCISCSYSDGSISPICGSIDCSHVQKEVVSIMEGGEEAFNRRKEIYGIWKTNVNH